jgi:hypothetical protein
LSDNTSPIDEETIKSAVAGDEPEIREPEDPKFQLPRGIFAEGTWQRDVEVRELTGSDEERLAKYQNEVELYNGILAMGTESIGSLDFSKMSIAEKEGAVAELLLGERDILMLEVTKVTFGNERTIGWKCSFCDDENETDLVISEDFQAKVPDDVTGPFSFKDSKGQTIEFRGVTGKDILHLNQSLSGPAKNSAVLSKVITRIDNDPPIDADGFVHNMGMKDRRELLDAVNKVQPVLDLSVKVPCHACGKENTLALTWVELFLS